MDAILFGSTYVLVFHEQESYNKIESRLGLMNDRILRINRSYFSVKYIVESLSFFFSSDEFNAGSFQL